MLKFALNDSISVHKIKHEDPEIVVYVIDDFLENPEELIDYAREKAYFGAVGDDRTAYHNIRDRLPSVYEQVLGEAVAWFWNSKSTTPLHAIVNDSQSGSIKHCSKNAARRRVR